MPSQHAGLYFASLPKGKTTGGIRGTANIIHKSFIEAHANLRGFILCDMWKNNLGIAKPLGKEGQKKVSNFHFEFGGFFFTFAGFFLKLTLANEVLCCEQQVDYYKDYICF